MKPGVRRSRIDELASAWLETENNFFEKTCTIGESVLEKKLTNVCLKSAGVRPSMMKSNEIDNSKYDILFNEP